MIIKYFTSEALSGRLYLRLMAIFFVANCFSVQAITVTTIGGNSQAGLNTGLQAFSSMNSPRGLAFDDDDNIYVSDYENHILKIDSIGNLSIYAGSGDASFKDASAYNAQFNQPQALAYYKNNLYIADTYNHCIRKLNLKNRLVTTIAGQPGIPGFVDGYPDQAKFNMPSGIAVDAEGNLFISDTLNRRVRKIDNSGKVSTIAGSGKNGFFDGPALNAEFRKPLGIAINAQGEIFISDRDNCRIRKLYQKNGIPVIETVIGTGMVGDKSGFAVLAQLNMPEDISFDHQGNLYISDTGNHKIKKYNPIKSEVLEIAGLGKAGYADNKSSESGFNAPSGLRFNSAGELIIADTKNNCVRKISFGNLKNNFEVNTIAGKNTSGSRDGSLGLAELNKPSSIAKDSIGNFYIADTENHLIRKLDRNGNLTRFAGSVQGYEDGDATKAKFSFPEDIIIDSQDNLFVADSGNHRIRKISKTGSVSSFAGDGLQDNDDGGFKNASFNYPKALAIDAHDNILVADSANNSVRLLIKQSSHVFTLAGNNKAGFIDGPALSASFNTPGDLVINPQGEIFVADTNNHAIRKISNNGGNWLVSTISGFFGSGNQDGSLNQASFNHPVSLDFDTDGRLYISDRDNNKIRMIDFTSSQTSSVSGIGVPGFLDSSLESSSFNHQEKIIFDRDKLLVADANNNRIRKLSLEKNFLADYSASPNLENKKPLIKLVNDLEFDQQNVFKIQEGNPLELKVFVYDNEDEYKSVAKTQWISNLQGDLTQGLKFNTKNLSAGKHTITIIAEDSQSAKKSLKINLEVVPKNVALAQEFGGCDKNGDGKINALDALDYGAPLKTIVEIIPPSTKLDPKKDSLKAFGGQINEVKEMVFSMDSQIVWEYEKPEANSIGNLSYREFLKQGPELELARIPKGVKKIYARLDNSETIFSL